MPEVETEQAQKKFGKSLHSKSGMEKSDTKTPRKSKLHGNSLGSPMSKKKLVDFISKGRRKDGKQRNPKAKFLNKQSFIRCQSEKLPSVSSNENGKHAYGDLTSEKFKKRRKRKRQKNNVELDEASRLQRRTRYLLIKMKVEQNLLDAYSTEGWKGQSREKIKPENELQRAKKQILKCKLGLRDAIRQLDLLSSAGCIDDSAIAPDGSVHHEHIHCAKCKLREAFPDNDIILCDGTCNCAFHQKCIDPPLLTENIPPGDQGWFCKFCVCKVDILEAMNAHLGTNFSTASNWQEIFKEEANLPDNGNTLLHPEQEWPSDDSEDDDYDPEGPEKFENSCSHSRVSSEADADDVSSSRDLCSLENEVFTESIRSKRRSISDSDETTDCEIISGRRQRRAVDYTKLYHEMFGKDAPINEQLSEDEDWGPTKRKRREKESDAVSTLMTLCETEKKCTDEYTTKVKTEVSCNETKRQFFRIPADAVEKLRLVFAENELPSRTVKENLAKQLGLDSEKVNKWFKNARYLALKTRKEGEDKPLQNVGPTISKASGPEIGKDETTDQIRSKDMSANVTHTPRNRHLKKFRRRKREILRSPGNNKADMEFGDDVSLKLLRENAKKEKKRVVFSGTDAEQEAEAEMERLSRMKSKLEKLQQVLQRLPNNRSHNKESSIIYVPVAELKEKI